MKINSLWIVIAILMGCSNNKELTSDTESLKEEIRKVETQFSTMAKEKGVKDAFLYYAAENAVINRGGKIIKGKQAIKSYFDSQTLQNVLLQWKPEFIDVSKSGDLAYTYGPFTFRADSTEGEEIKSEGFFHTVWKRQADGKWKFVYD